MAPVVYQALEKIEFVKVAAVLLLIVVASLFAIERGRVGGRAADRHAIRASRPSELGFALLLGALAFAGAGGGQNLCQSNWIRDKRFGMGAYVPRIVSPVTGHPEAAPSTGYVFEPTAREPRAVAALVALREHRAADDLREHQLPVASCSPRCWPTPRSSARRGSPATSPSSRSRETR